MEAPSEAEDGAPRRSGQRRALEDLPLPSGWFAVSTSADLAPGAVRPARFGDDELVVWRDDRGSIGLAGAFCPHLGAHLGHVGRARDGLLECGFHGFRFDTSGTCRGTGYGGRVPAGAALEPRPVLEVGGLVLGWFGPPGSPPSWSLPPVEEHGWSATAWHTEIFRGHPLDVTENSIDIGHFSFLHEYGSIEVLQAATTDGPVLRTSYRISRSRPLFGIPMPAMEVDFEVEAFGLGCARADLHVRTIGARVRLTFASTPIGAGRIVLRSGAAVRRYLEPGAPRLLASLPAGLVARLVRSFTLLNVRADVNQDRPIWETKAHLRHPMLADGDGPIGLYRRWAGQFVGERAPSWQLEANLDQTTRSLSTQFESVK